MRCKCPAAIHPFPKCHLDALLRADVGSVDSILTADHGHGSKPLSKLPLSPARYAQERNCWKGRGGLEGLSQQFAASVCAIGRDLGGVPKVVPRKPQCGDVCHADLAKYAGHPSLATQLQESLADIVTHHGGPKQIPALQPLASLVRILTT